MRIGKELEAHQVEKELELWQWCTTSLKYLVPLDKGHKSESSQNETLLYF